MVLYGILFALLILLFVIFNTQYRLFYPASKKLRVLEYHSISTNGFEDQITISKEKFILQMEYLKKKNYKTFWLSEIEAFQNQKKPLPPKSVVLTFDDGFLDTYTELFPLLKEYDFKAVCFLVLGRIGKNIDWPGKYVDHSTMLMNKEQIIASSSHIEFGYHSFKHDNYTKLTFEEIEKDLQLCQEVIAKEQLTVYPALAYTFGRYFRKKGTKQQQFFALLEKYGIQYGLRIGNRINSFPLNTKYEIQRTDIRGFEPMEIFKKKIVLGRSKLF